MTIVEIKGGPVTHRYLMNKRKDDLARMYMDLLRELERVEYHRDKALEKVGYLQCAEDSRDA